ncbi:MAG: aspartate kinase [Christensenellales bacterium]
MDTIVTKFGGSSVANAQGFVQVGDIVRADERRRYVVVSAPGKADSKDHKITDMLLMCYQLASHRLGFEDVFSIIAARYRDIHRTLGLTLDLDAELNQIEARIRAGASRDYCASRGEYLCALLMAEYLDLPFVDSSDLIVFDPSGHMDEAATYEAIRVGLNGHERAVIPGFYGADAQGNLITFARGGSDITGAVIARGVRASLYENWTDVSGFLMADPRIVPNPRPIHSITFRELRELSYMGAQVLQEDAIFPVREAGIPIHIRNTHRPEDPGTLIVPEQTERKGTIVTGIAGKKDFRVINVEKTRLREEGDFLRKLISVFESNEVPIENMPSCIDSVSVIVSQADISGKERKILEEIRIYCSPDALVSMPSIALIAVVGQGMIHAAGSAARVFRALGDDKVNIRLISQGSSELNILIGVDNQDFENAIRAIYKAFVQEEA